MHFSTIKLIFQGVLATLLNFSGKSGRESVPSPEKSGGSIGKNSAAEPEFGDRPKFLDGKIWGLSYAR